jgi:hypothetical protein
MIIDKSGEVRSVQEKTFAPTFDEEKGYLFWPRKSFAKSFHGVDFPDEMNDLEIGRMARLAKRIWSNTNMLGYRGNGGIKPHTIDSLAEILKMKPRQTYRFIEKMIRLGVLARVEIKTDKQKEVQLYVNPVYFCSTNRIPLNLYLLFRKQLDKEFPDWVKEKYRQQNGYEGENKELEKILNSKSSQP